MQTKCCRKIASVNSTKIYRKEKAQQKSTMCILRFCGTPAALFDAKLLFHALKVLYLCGFYVHIRYLRLKEKKLHLIVNSFWQGFLRKNQRLRQMGVRNNLYFCSERRVSQNYIITFHLLSEIRKSIP